MTKKIWLADKESLDELVECENELISRVRAIDDSEIIEAGTDFLQIQQLARQYAGIADKWKQENLKSLEKGTKAAQRLNKEIDAKVNTLMKNFEKSFRQYYNRIDSAFFMHKNDIIKSGAVRKKLNLLTDIYNRISQNSNEQSRLIDKYTTCLGLMNILDAELINAQDKLKYAETKEDLLLIQYELEDAKKNYFEKSKKIKPSCLFAYNKPFDYEEGIKKTNQLIEKISSEYINFEQTAGLKKEIKQECKMLEETSIHCADLIEHLKKEETDSIPENKIEYKNAKKYEEFQNELLEQDIFQYKQLAQESNAKIKEYTVLCDKIKPKQKDSSVFELSDFLAAVKEPDSIEIHNIIETLRGNSGVSSWNERFKKISEYVAGMETTNNYRQVSCLKALASSMKESLAEGGLAKATRCYGLSERLVREAVDAIKNYVCLSEENMLARAS